MDRKAALPIDATFGILVAVAFLIVFGLIAFKIPGFLGMLLGFMSAGLFTIADTIWGMVGQLLLPIINAVKNSYRVFLAVAITGSTIGFVSSFLAGGTARNVIGILASASKVGWRFAIKDAWSVGKVGLISGLKGAIKGGVICAGAYLLSDLAIVPYVTQNYGPVAGNAVGGGIEGSATGWFVGGAIASAATSGAVGGPVGLAIGLPSGIVASLVKEHSGLTGAAGAAATIGSAAATGAAMGALIGTFVCPALGTAVGAGVGALVGGIIGAFQWFF